MSLLRKNIVITYMSLCLQSDLYLYVLININFSDHQVSFGTKDIINES